MLPKINFSRLKEGLAKTRDSFVKKITESVTRKAVLDSSTIDNLEEALISCDLGFDLTEKIIENSRSKLLGSGERSFDNILDIIKDELKKIIVSEEEDFISIVKKSDKPFVILFVGINGAGKTTTLGKLALKLKENGLSVVIGSADTFRAAANAQLKIWADKAKVDIIEKKSNDPASVAYETVKKAISEKIDVVLIDTAGRLHNNKNLMEEIKKIQKVVSDLITNNRMEILLVLDGNAGQNAIVQAHEFGKYVDITGLIITKLDGSAKGGAIFQICDYKRIPIRFIGVGEAIDDLQQFSTENYIDALFSNK